MPRSARVVLPHHAYHVTQRGHNHCALFETDRDRRFFLTLIGELKQQSLCRVSAYCLMTNHVHLLLTPKEKDGAGQLMKRLGQRYVQYINRTYKRSGTLWEGRFRSCLAREENYILSCYRYIELNPVRAKIVDHPAEYRWSSYRANAQGETLPFIRPHGLYVYLGRNACRREQAYRELFRNQLDPGMVDEIRHATNGNYALGSERFRQEVEIALGRRARPGRPGRPTVQVS